MAARSPPKPCGCVGAGRELSRTLLCEVASQRLDLRMEAHAKKPWPTAKTEEPRAEPSQL